MIKYQNIELKKFTSGRGRARYIFLGKKLIYDRGEGYRPKQKVKFLTAENKQLVTSDNKNFNTSR